MVKILEVVHIGLCLQQPLFSFFSYHKVASRSTSRLVPHPRIFRLFMKGNLMLMYCDLWPKEFKIE